MTGFWIGSGLVLGAVVTARIVWMAYEHDRLIRRVDAFLTIWAKYGHWPPECQAALNVLLHDTDVSDDPPSMVGMDFGMGLMVTRFLKRG